MPWFNRCKYIYGDRNRMAATVVFFIFLAAMVGLALGLYFGFKTVKLI